MGDETSARREARWGLLENLRGSAYETLLAVANGEAPPVGTSVHEAFAVSQLALPGYCTLCERHIANLRTTILTMKKYVDDESRPRPCNFILTAAAGSGKSRLVDCLAREVAPHYVTANLANMPADDLAYSLEEVRNFKAQDRVPLLFVDEADTREDDLTRFLSLMWDGAFYAQGRKVRVGRCIIVFAVSKPEVVRSVDIEDACDPETDTHKIADFLSRVNGGLIKIPKAPRPHKVPEPEVKDTDKYTDEDRKVDQLCVAIALLKRRFKNLKCVQAGYLRLLAVPHFRHEVRSVEALVNHLPNDPDSEELIYSPSSDNSRVGQFFEKATFRENVFRFHLDKLERDQAVRIWRSLAGALQPRINLSVSLTCKGLLGEFADPQEGGS